MQQARYYREEVKQVRCLLCPTACLLKNGQTGNCGVRKAVDGDLYSTNYGYVAAAHWDPIEKKPLYHFYPGRSILSIGTYGCNFFCPFCQNWSLARGKPEQSANIFSPQEILTALQKEGGPEKTLGVAYTYNEPLVWYEFVFDTAQLLHKEGYKNVLVTNGYINSEPLSELLPFIDAMNIDMKAFNDTFYSKYCRGSRQAVIKTVEMAVKNCHVELTCLLIPGLNDNADEQEEMARWLSNLNPDLVLHYSRYFPQYKLDLPPTEPQVMEEMLAVAKKYLHYVYLGNIDLPGSADTVCPHCGNLLIVRSGYRVQLTGLNGQYCQNCGNRIAITLAD